MAIKAAKESFEKDDIIEILKRNVALYKDEREFVEYIVNLAMYLMDQYYGSKKDDDDLEDISLEFPMPPISPASPIKAPSPVRFDAGDSSSSSQLPPTAQELKRRQAEPRTFQAFTTTGPKEPDESDFKMPPRPGVQRPAASYTPAHRGEDDVHDLEVEAAPLMTPLGDALRDPAKRGKKPEEQGPEFQKAKQQEDESPKVDVRNQGRTRVYRVVRSYKSATNLESPCPICGTMVAMGEKQCTNCGHIM